MKRQFILTALVVVQACTAIPGQANNAGTARVAIDSTYRSFEEAFARGDARAIAASYAEDAERLLPSMPVVRGRAAIEAAWINVIGQGGNRLRIEVAEVDERGDRAHEVGRFTVNSPDGNVVSAGKHIVIWARRPNGEWQAYRDIFNWDVPPRQPERAEPRGLRVDQ